jgi:glycosyltransferase involved in cell wall biosynthesis
MIEEADCGSFFPAGHHDDITKAILELFHGNGLADIKGQNGRKYAEAHFSRHGSTDMYHDIISEAYT